MATSSSNSLAYDGDCGPIGHLIILTRISKGFCNAPEVANILLRGEPDQYAIRNKKFLLLSEKRSPSEVILLIYLMNALMLLL
jgi:hypothetical protein